MAKSSGGKSGSSKSDSKAREAARAAEWKAAMERRDHDALVYGRHSAAHNPDDPNYCGPGSPDYPRDSSS